MRRLNQLSVLLLMCISSSFVTATTVTPRVALQSLAPVIVNKGTLAGEVDPNEKITFTLWLKFRNKAKMDQLARDIYDRHSPRYHQFMTKDEYQTLFAPTPDTKKSVQHYFLNNGLHAVIVANMVKVSGTVRQVGQVLQIKFNRYRYKDKFYYGTISQPSLPVAIAESIHSITGLTNIPRFHAFASEHARSAQLPPQPPHEFTFKWNTWGPLTTATDNSLSGFSASTLQTVYQLSSIAPIYGRKIDGSGQTIVIVDDVSVNSPSQIINDANQYGSGVLPALTSANFAAIDANGNPCTTQCTGSGSGTETGLDVESAHTLAPGANIVLALGDTFDDTLANVIDILINNNHVIAGFSNAHVISNSWGDSETANESLESSLQSAVMNGISVNFSSGDCGDRTSAPIGDKCQITSSASVIYPASSTYATAIGATSLFVDANWHYVFELGWGNYFSNNANFHAGVTGGISKYYGPASWQSIINNFNAVGYNNGTIASYNKRATPDVEMLGDPQTGLRIVVGGTALVDGGTSLACPLFTAVLALSNQARAIFAGGENPIGHAAPMLYNNYNALVANKALNLITAPHIIISGATKPTAPQIAAGAPLSAFTLYHNLVYITFGWDSTLGVIESQYWNDQTGLGSLAVPNFIALAARL